MRVGGGLFKSPSDTFRISPGQSVLDVSGRGFVTFWRGTCRPVTWGFVGCRRRGSPGFRPSQDHCENPGQRGCLDVGVSFANGFANGRSVIVVGRPQRSGRKSFGLYSSSTSQLRSASTDGWSSRTRRVVGGFELDLVLALADRNAGSRAGELAVGSAITSAMGQQRVPKPAAWSGQCPISK